MISVAVTQVNYLSISTQNVAPPQTTPAKWQYKGTLADGTGSGFMLNTDFELFYNLTFDATSAKTTCTLNPTCGLSTPNTCSGSCQPATTFSQALGYSQVLCYFFIMLPP